MKWLRRRKVANTFVLLNDSFSLEAALIGLLSVSVRYRKSTCLRSSICQNVCGTMANPYNVYTLSNFLPPFLVSVVMVAFAGIFISCVFLYAIVERKVLGLSGMYAAISVIFRDAIKKKVVGKETIYLLFRREIHPISILLLFLLVPGLFSCFFTTFWEVFLTDESFTCDTGLDCFPFDASNLSILQNNPIVNCSEFATTDNVTITCYQFVFRYATATGLLGGLLTVTVIGIKVLGGVLIWSMDIGEKKEHTEEESDETQKHCSKCKSCCRSCYTYLKVFVRFALAGFPSLASVLATILVVQVPLLRDAVYGTRERRVQFISYIVLSFYLGFLVPILTIMLACSKPYESLNITVNIHAQNGDLENGQANGTSVPQDSKGVPHRIPLLSVEKHSPYGTAID